MEYLRLFVAKNNGKELNIAKKYIFCGKKNKQKEDKKEYNEENKKSFC
jgi:hypothetical protein